MHLHDELNRVLRYALIPHTEVAPFVKGSEGRRDTITPRVLADKLDEHDDPRADIIRRHLGETSHPEPDAFNDYSQEAGRHTIIEQGAGHDPDGRSWLTFQPVRRDRSEPGTPAAAVRVMYSHWTPRSDGQPPKSLHFAGHFTPDETRALADRLPAHHAAALHQLLDTTFGKRGE